MSTLSNTWKYSPSPIFSTHLQSTSQGPVSHCMLYRKFYKNAHTSTVLQLYISFTQPHLEYILLCSVGSLPCKGRGAAGKNTEIGLRVCLKNWSSDYNSHLSQVNIPTLTTRHSQARLSHMFKIMHEQTDFLHVPIICRSFHYNSRFDNSMAIRPFRCHSTQLLLFLNSFFPRTASQWNSLWATVVSHSSTLAFKHSITNLV